VRKTDNNRVDTFVAAEWGALGVVDADRIVFRRMLATKHTTTSELHLDPPVAELPSVPIVADYVGTDAAMLRSLPAAGVDGVVVQAFGGGRASPETRRAVAELAAAGIPVVLASRVPEGRVMGSVEAVERGVLTAGDLPPHKARVLMMLALTRDRTPSELQRLLDTH
jgi:L-asparaginase